MLPIHAGSRRCAKLLDAPQHDPKWVDNLQGLLGKSRCMSMSLIYQYTVYVVAILSAPAHCLIFFGVWLYIGMYVLVGIYVHVGHLHTYVFVHVYRKRIRGSTNWGADVTFTYRAVWGMLVFVSSMVEREGCVGDKLVVRTAVLMVVCMIHII
jgi:hypothetical protein